mmetsp:Transcript_22495/g.57889  ORF Transcript_22495/g.57889 Transcript_22495/m.57889 type:complete len:247 (+) Transcript_22495:281-1021(+)
MPWHVAATGMPSVCACAMMSRMVSIIEMCVPNRSCVFHRRVAIRHALEHRGIGGSGVSSHNASAGSGRLHRLPVRVHVCVQHVLVQGWSITLLGFLFAPFPLRPGAAAAAPSRRAGWRSRCTCRLGALLLLRRGSLLGEAGSGLARARSHLRAEPVGLLRRRRHLPPTACARCGDRSAAAVARQRREALTQRHPLLLRTRGCNDGNNATASDAAARAATTTGRLAATSRRRLAPPRGHLARTRVLD